MSNSPPKTPEQRLVAVEERLMYAEQLLDKLNEVLCEAQNRLDEQNRAIRRLGESLERIAAKTAEPRSPEDERPPHY